jgi:abhydrolase domain-containing protein 14
LSLVNSASATMVRCFAAWCLLLLCGPLAVTTKRARNDVPERLTLQLPSLSASASLEALCLRDGRSRGLPVLLLHGASFSADTWRETGTLAALRVSGRDACALDYTTSSPLSLRTALLPAVLDALGWERAVVVAPSAAGRIIFPFLANAGRAEADRLAGVVSIAAVSFAHHAAGIRVNAAARAVPALIVWGEKDHPEQEVVGQQMEAFTRSEQFVMRGAGHACYVDAPAVFHVRLLSWLESLDTDTRRG